MDILHRVGIKAPSQQVYQALTTTEGLAGWFTNAMGESKVGGVIKLRFHHPDGREVGGAAMKVLELRSAQHVLWQTLEGPPDWVGTRVSFDLRQDGEYCIVLFKHADWKEAGEFMHHCSTKWATFLLSLKELIETGKGAPSPHDIQISDWH